MKYLLLLLLAGLVCLVDDNRSGRNGEAFGWLLLRGATCFYLGHELFKFVGLLRPHLVEVGQLTSSEDQLMLTLRTQQRAFALNSTTRVHIDYRGYRNECITHRIRATGIDNFIRINDSRNFRFEMPTEEAQEDLRTELRRWYLRRVHLKENRQDGPTFLLHRNLSYEQIQDYKREFGVSLYG